MGYVIEVQNFKCDGHIINPSWCGKAEHVGYMNVHFKSKRQACLYYDCTFPEMPKMNRHGDSHSSVHPDGRLFIVRRSKHEYKKIPPFDEAELPTYELTKENNLRVVYPRYQVLTDNNS